MKRQTRSKKSKCTLVLKLGPERNCYSVIAHIKIVFVDVGKNVSRLRLDLLVCTQDNDLESKGPQFNG